MKKLLLLSVGVAFVFPAMVFAGNKNMAGCGLGSQWFKDDSKTDQILAATTNGSSGNQTFGISTGTSDCTSGGAVKSEREQEVFVAMNFETLTEEMARGTGEGLGTLAHLFGCPASASDDFGRMTQSRYTNELSKASTPDDLLQAVRTGVKADAGLSQTCRVQG